MLDGREGIHFRRSVGAAVRGGGDVLDLAIKDIVSPTSGRSAQRPVMLRSAIGMELRLLPLPMLCVPLAALLVSQPENATARMVSASAVSVDFSTDLMVFVFMVLF